MDNLQEEASRLLDFYNKGKITEKQLLFLCTEMREHVIKLLEEQKTDVLRKKYENNRELVKYECGCVLTEEDFQKSFGDIYLLSFCIAERLYKKTSVQKIFFRDSLEIFFELFQPELNEMDNKIQEFLDPICTIMEMFSS